MKRFIIDCPTKTKGLVLSKLRKLKWVETVWDKGPYWLKIDISGVLLITTKSWEFIDTWLYNQGGVEYISVNQIDNQGGV